jgi:hypothetical protein
MIDVRLRSQIPEAELEQKIGKIVTPKDYNLLLTGPCRLAKPNGQLLGVYLPGVLKPVVTPVIYEILHALRSLVTDNRGNASGSMRFRYGDEKRTRSLKVRSIIIGAFDPGGPKQFCRQTSWTSHHIARWDALRPLFVAIGKELAAHAPDRYEAQMEQVRQTDPAWVIPGTPFTTITVNNTFPTGVHTDKGDLDAGLSTMAVIRRGDYTGGVLVLPKYRVGVDMQDGDLIMFDAHEFHGNTQLELRSDDAERISVVSYYRTGMVSCGPADEEFRKAVLYAERRGGVAREYGAKDRPDCSPVQ